VPSSFSTLRRRRVSRYHLPHQVRAACSFEGEVKDAIVALKYRNKRRLAAQLAEVLVGALIEEFGDLVDIADAFDVVTWAPTTGEHRRRRGMDHAELIARHTGRLVDVPVRPLLRRRGTVTQTGRSRSERLSGPTFVAHPAAEGARILVIDDVTTTGSTLRAARRAFRSVGADLVECWAVAATP